MVDQVPRSHQTSSPHQAVCKSGPRLITPAALLESECYAAMDILNGVAERFPSAISLAAGRPPSAFLPATRTPDLVQRGIARAASQIVGPGTDSAKLLERTWTRFGQYADTDGIIHRDLLQLFARLEGIADPHLDLRVTNGIQEALLIEAMAAAAQGGAILCFDPVYAGVTGVAAALGLPLFAIPRGAAPAEDIAAAVRLARQTVPGTLLLYLIPDHDNPTGLSLTLQDRRDIVALAQREQVIVLEDTAYRLFNYDNERLPSLLSFDQDGGTVIYLASFSKTLMPGVRLGFSVRRPGRSFTPGYLKQLTNIKSYVSVTTAPLAQAIVSGFLDECGFDLDQANQAKRAYCKANRDTLVRALNQNLAGTGIGVIKPAGGFFLTLQTAWRFDQAAMERAARDFSVIFIPMQLFSPSGQGAGQVRLSFSAGGPAEMIEGAARLADFLTEEMRHHI